MKTYWQSNETPARKVRVLIAPTDLPRHWARDLANTTRDGVAVEWKGDTILIDDADGSGWRCVTNAYALGGYAKFPQGSQIVGER